uniref:Uncharacterized protein n=1 Tax=Lygus hesperus TaxID=30085 RepID=A0A0K8T3D7_LYGHE
MDSETGKKSESTSKIHLQGKEVESDIDEVSLASAVQFFSVKTATALECAVSSRTISPDALSTAYFCRLVEQWFSICDSKSLDDGITVDNKQFKFEFLERFVDIIRDVKIYDGRSPINHAIIMSTISLREVTNILLQQEGFGVVLLRRFSQKAVENVISQMRDCPRSTPTQFSVESLEVLKTITINQLVCDVDRSFLTTLNTNLVRITNNCTSPRTADHQKPQKRSRKVPERVSTAEAASTPQKRKRAEIEHSRRNGGVGKPKKTSNVAEVKSKKQKGKDVKSKSRTERLTHVLGRPKRNTTSKFKSEDFCVRLVDACGE